MRLAALAACAVLLVICGFAGGLFYARGSNKVPTSVVTQQNNKINAVTITEKVKQRHKDGATTERVVTTRTEQKTSAEKTRKENVSEKAPKVDRWRVGVEWDSATQRPDAISLSRKLLPNIDATIRIDREKKVTVGLGVSF